MALAGQDELQGRETSINIQAVPAAEGPRLIIISDHVKDHSLLLDAVIGTTRAVELKYEEDSLDSLLDKINVAARGAEGTLLSIALLDHGANGEFFFLKGLNVTVETLKANAQLREFFKAVARLLRRDKDALDREESTDSENFGIRRSVSIAATQHRMGEIHLLACSLAAAGGKKAALVTSLEDIMDVNVCASVDVTSHAEEGGNWILETDDRDVAAMYFDADKLSKWHNTLNTAMCLPMIVGIIGSVGFMFGIIWFLFTRKARY